MIRTQFQLTKKEHLLYFGSALIVYLLAFIIAALFFGENGFEKSTGVLEMIITAIFMTLIHLICIMFSFGVKFNMALTMGITRKNFTIGYVVVTGSQIAGVWLLINACHAVEKIIYETFFPEKTLENILSLGQQMSYVVPGLLLLLAVEVFFGVIILKFGMKGYWVIWIIWVLVFTGIPAAEKNAALAGTMHRLMKWGIDAMGNMIGWILSLVLSGILVALIWLMLRRQAVTS